MKIAKLMSGVCLTLLSCAAAAVAQTGVTTSGTTTVGTIPVFGPSSNATVTNSPIAISGSNVGIGTTNQFVNLNVNGEIQAVYPGVVGPDIEWSNPSKTTNGTANHWDIYNMTGGYGNSLQFWDYDTIGCGTGGMCNPRLTLMDNGNVGIGTTAPSGPLTVKGNGAGGTGQLQLFDSSGNYIAYIGTEATAGAIISGDAVGDLSINQMSAHNINFTTNNGRSQLVIQNGGNVGIGTTSPGAKLEVNGGLRFTNDPAGTVQTTAWTGVLCGGDYAESVDVNGDRTKYQPGDVLVIDPKHPGRFLKSAEPYSTTVTGIFATKPGVVGRRQTGPKKPDEVPMAMIGIVPTRVSAENGPIHAGDLLVTSSTLGYAMKGTDHSRMPGAIVGKALGNLDSGRGVIEVVVTLQ